MKRSTVRTCLLLASTALALFILFRNQAQEQNHLLQNQNQHQNQLQTPSAGRWSHRVGGDGQLRIDVVASPDRDDDGDDDDEDEDDKTDEHGGGISEEDLLNGVVRSSVFQAERKLSPYERVKLERLRFKGVEVAQPTTTASTKKKKKDKEGSVLDKIRAGRIFDLSVAGGGGGTEEGDGDEDGDEDDDED